jgi:hemerythrin superfamily protein
MATTAASKAKKSARAKAPTSHRASKTDAVSLLEDQHKQVKGWFEEFEKARSDSRKTELYGKIAVALKAHTRIEEEIFYPEARLATGDEDLLDEAVVEHAAAKDLIAQIDAMQVGDDLYDAKVKVLGEEIDHHVTEEEDELFPECRKSDMDLEALGARMAARFKELTAELKADTPSRH